MYCFLIILGLHNCLSYEYTLAWRLKMNFVTKITTSLLIGLTASSVLSQPGYYNSPPPGYATNPGYMTNSGYVPAAPQNIPPPAYYGNRGNNYGNRSYGRSMPANRYNNAPWQRFGNAQGNGYNNAPWNRFNNGWGNGNNNYGPDTDWFKDTPQRWTRQSPKEGAGQVFDDFLDAPSRLGDMPPGLSAPTISVPNPIDVADELERGSKDIIKLNK